MRVRRMPDSSRARLISAGDPVPDDIADAIVIDDDDVTHDITTT
jgi:hypothetical protein